MNLRKIEVDPSQKEFLQYKDPNFLFEVWTDDYRYFVDKTLNCHWHHEFEFGVMLSGELDYTISGIHYTLKKGDCIFVNSDTMHMAKQVEKAGGEHAVMYIIAFPASLLVSNMSSTIYLKYFQPMMGKTVPGLFISQEQEIGRDIAGVLQNIYELDEEDQGYELKCLGLVCRLWYNMLRYVEKNNPEILQFNANRRSEERAKTILCFIRDNYSESISVIDMAKYANISKSECFRCFKQFTNKRPNEYLNDFRLTKAAQQLMETSDAVTDIALSNGFSNAAYFCKLFKAKYNITPTHYRNFNRQMMK